MDQNPQIDNQLYEWSLKKILLVAGAGIAALIGKGVKVAINSATVKANKGKLDKRLLAFKERMTEEINTRVARYQKDSEDEDNPKLTKEKKRSYQKGLLDLVKKEISAESKRVSMIIDKAPAGKRGKESLKIYWETITTSVELDLLEQLHKLDIIGEEDRDAYSEKASADLEKIINIFLKKFGMEAQEEPKLTEFQKIQRLSDDIKKDYPERNDKSIEELEDILDKIELWRELIDKVKDKLSDDDRKGVRKLSDEMKQMEEDFDTLYNDLVLSKKQRDYEEILLNYMETLFKGRAKYVKQTFDLATYNEYADVKRMNRFVQYVVGEIMDDPDEYEKQAKILQNKTISDKQLLILFLKVFMRGFEESENEKKNENFMSLYDYIENQV